MRAIVGLVNGIVLSFGFGFLATTPARAADGSATYRRVLVVTDDQGATEAQKLAFADGFSSAIERAVNLNVGRVIYGRRAGNAGAGATPLAFLIKTIQDVNAALNETFMTNATYEQYLIKQLEQRAGSDPWILGFDMRKVPLYSRFGNPFEQALGQINAGDTRTITYEVLTVPAATDLPEPDPNSFIGKLRDSGINLTGLMLQAAKVGDAKEYDQVLALYDQVNGFAAVDAATAQQKDLYRLAHDAYVTATHDEGMAWMPMYLAVSLNYGPQGVQPSMRVILRPGTGMGGPVGEQGAAYDALPAAQKIVQKTILDYVPQLSFNSDSPAAMAIAATAQFGAADQKRPVAKITWGRMNIPTDVRTITQCTTQCDGDLSVGSIGKNYPTINGIFRFEFIEALAANDSNKSFFGKFKEAIKRKINQAIQSGTNLAASAADKTNFHLMIQTLAIELGTDVMRVVPSESQFTLGIGDGKKAITVNAASNTVAGVDLNMVGFDMYAKVAPDIAASFSTEINAQFKDGKLINQKDFDAKQASFMQALEPITKALNSF